MAIVLDDPATESHLRDLAAAAGISLEAALKLCVSGTPHLAMNVSKTMSDAGVAERRRRRHAIMDSFAALAQGRMTSADIDDVIGYDEEGVPK